MRGSTTVRACLFLAFAAPVAAEAPLRTTLRDEAARTALKDAMDGALRRLESPACQRVFGDFKNASGRTLQGELDALGVSGPAFMGWIFFADGGREGRCADPGVLAVTETGSRSIWICPGQFTRVRRRDPRWTEVVLIHEALHSLGLGENPPSSQAISSRVEARCSDSPMRREADARR
jgi:hypothetical protein